MNNLRFSFLQFRENNKSIFLLVEKVILALVWIFFILVTLAQVYFNTLPFDEAIGNASNAVNYDLTVFFYDGKNIFFNEQLLQLYKSLFQPIFFTSSIVALVGTWVLSQGRSVWEAFVLFIAYGLPKIRKDWGLVVDSTTGNPIPFAYVRVYNTENNKRKLVNESVTDLDGRYRLFIPKNTKIAEIEIKSPEYSPLVLSKIFKPDQNSYFASEISLNKLDQNSADNSLSLQAIKKSLKKPLTFLILFFSFVATIHSIYGLLAIPQFDTLAFVLIYGLGFLWNITVLRQRSKRVKGRIIDEESKEPIKNMQVELLDLNRNLVEKQITDSFGVINFKKTHAGSYFIKLSNGEVLPTTIDSRGYTTKNIYIKDDKSQKFANQSINPFS